MNKFHAHSCEWSRYKEDRQYKCTEPVGLGNGSLCILHDPDTEKDVDLFDETLNAKIDNQEIDESICVVDLSGVVFPAEADFRGQVFRSGLAAHPDAAISKGMEFKKIIRFAEAQFTKGAWFTAVRFAGANFNDAQFGGRAHFDSAEFASHAAFIRANFADGARFSDATFVGHANFRSAKFASKVIFRDTVFVEDVDFVGTAVNRMDLVRTCFPMLSSSRSRVQMYDMSFESPRDIRFDKVDLSRVSFLRTRLDQIQLVDCTWGEKRDCLLWPLLLRQPEFIIQSRNAIYDDMLLDELEQEVRLVEMPNRRLVAELYRQLRLNLESNRQEIEAGDFYIGQMEMRRQDTSYPWLYRLLLAGYRVLAMYGQSYWRPLFWYAFILAPLFALGYWYLGTDSYQNSLFSALTAGALVKGVPSDIVHAERLLVFGNMLADILLLGLILVALKRHFSR